MINALIHQAPAETTNYLIAGYSVIFGILFLYIASLLIRTRNLKRQLEMLKELDQTQK